MYLFTSIVCFELFIQTVLIYILFPVIYINIYTHDHAPILFITHDKVQPFTGGGWYKGEQHWNRINISLVLLKTVFLSELFTSLLYNNNKFTE